jgi:Fe-S cluster assembly protein SufB
MSNKEQFKKDREYQYDFKDNVKSIFSTGTGLSEDIIRAISKEKNEPEWMLEFRLDAYRKFIKMPNPSFGPDVSNLDFDSYTYYTRYVKGDKTDWNDVPETIKNTFNKLGIPEQEQKYLSGAATQYESEMVYHNMLKEVEEKGVIFLSTDMALQKFPDLFKKFFGTVVPVADNKGWLTDNRVGKRDCRAKRKRHIRNSLA